MFQVMEDGGYRLLMPPTTNLLWARECAWASVRLGRKVEVNSSTFVSDHPPQREWEVGRVYASRPLMVGT